MSLPSEIVTDIETLIENEKRELTREMFAELWDELAEDGVSAKMIAEVTIEASLKRLVRDCGDTEASKLIEQLKQLDAMSILPEGRTLQ